MEMASGNSISLPSPQTAAGGDQRLQSEIFYLIVRHLRSFDSLKESANDLEAKLLELGALGTSFDWTGNCKQVTMNDFDKKYPMVPNCQLSQLLVSSSSGPSKSQHCSSLLRVNGLFDPSNSDARRLFTDTSKQLLHALVRLHETANGIKKAKELKKFIEHRLETNFADEVDEPVVDLTFDLTHGDIDFNNDAVLHLKHIGSTKQVARLERQIMDYESTAVTLKQQIHDVVTKLTENGCRVASGSRNHIDSTVRFLHTREIGVTSMLTDSRGYRGFATAPSALTARNRLTNNFHMLYTISGHMTNPAYCCVFDRTGKFLITGADDYLVKIWDVHAGHLVRTCRGHMSYISFIVVSPDNSIFASSCTNGSVRIWRLRDGLCLRVFQLNSTVHWMQFDPASCSLATGSENGICNIWDLSRVLPPDCTAVPLLDKVLMRKHSHLKTDNGSRCIGAVVSQGDDFEVTEVMENVMYRPFTGLFEWSKDVDSSAVDVFSASAAPIAPPTVLASKDVLTLPHVNELVPGINAQNQASKVWCLDIASVGNVVVTGCDDGVARLWKFGNLDEDEVSISTDGNVHNKYPLRSPKRPLESRLMKVKESCGNADKPIWERFVKHLLLRLEGHAHPITDIHFNSLGDRVLTGSEKGGVRIWSLAKDYMDSVQLVLDLTEEDEQQQLMMGGGRGMRRGSNNRSKMVVHNVCWTCNDLRVVTLQSVPMSNGNGSSSNNNESLIPTRLKVWDAITGDLLRIIRTISGFPTKCLARHPYNPHLVVTGGDDGMVSVWNIDTEENLSQTKVQIVLEEQTKPLHVTDLSISPDGHTIAATDSHGQLTVIGLDNPLRFAHVLKEQYYSTDYADVMVDDQGYAIDVGTQLPADRAPLGPLCTVLGIVHANQPHIVCHPQPCDDIEVDGLIEQVIQDRQRLPQEMERMFSIFAKNKNSNRVSKKYSARMGGSLTRLPNSSPARNLGGDVSSQVNRNNNNNNNSVRYIEFDELTSSDDSDDHSGRRMNQSSRGRRSQRNSGSNVHTLRDLARNMNDSNSLRRSSRNRQHFSSYDDQFVDEEEAMYGNSTTARLPTRAERAAARAAARESNRANRQSSTYIHNLESDGSEFASGDEEDDDDVNSDLVNSDDEDRKPRRRSGRPPKPSRRSRLDTDGEELEISDGSENRASSRRSRPLTEEFASRRVQRGESTGRVRGRRRRTPEGSELMGLELDRSWLQQDAPSEYVYSPQVGDIVVYFPQGHKEQLTHFTESSSPPWVSFGQRLPFYECMVQDIAYEFPTEQEFRICKSAVAKITLVVLRIPSRTTLTTHGSYVVSLMELRSTRHSSSKAFSFEVKLRNSGLADFVIPASIFHRSIRLSWHQGVEILCKFSEVDENGENVLKDYLGRVVRLCNSDSEWPHSPWEALEVVWDSADSNAESNAPPETQRISPWDAVPRHSPTPCVLPKVDKELCIRIEAAIADLMNEKGDRYSPFEYEVDSVIFPHYYSLIAVPSYVDLIRRRLKSDYYRQIVSLEWDINLLYQNCEAFNQQGSDIVNAARELRDDLLSIVHASQGSSSTTASVGAGYSSSMLREESSGRASRKSHRRDDPTGETLMRLGDLPQPVKDSNTAAQAMVGDEDLDDLKLRFKRRKIDSTDPTLTLHLSPRKTRGQAANSENNTTSNSRSRTALQRGGLESSDDEEEDEEMESEEHNDESDASSEDSETSEAPRRTRSTRSSKTEDLVLRIPKRDVNAAKRRSRQVDESEEDGADDTGAEEEEEFDTRGRSSRRSVGRAESAVRTSSRRQNVSLSFHTEAGQRRNSSSSTTRPTRSSTAASVEENFGASRRTRGVQRVSYVEKSSEEEDEEEEEEEESIDERRSSRRRLSTASDRSVVHSEHSSTGNNNSGRKTVRLDPETKRQMLDVLEFASDLDKKVQLFADPVDPEFAPGYYDIIETPMDLSLIRSNITSRRYESVQEVIRDILLIYANCEIYNDVTSDIVKESRRQQRLFKQYVRSSYQHS